MSIQLGEIQNTQKLNWRIMPNKEFLETYALYRKFPIKIPVTLDYIQREAINMFCNHCKSNQTYAMVNNYHNGFQDENKPSGGETVKLIYLCSHCQKFERHFFVLIDKDLKWIMKVGQWPSWDISYDQNLEKMLGTHIDYYKKGLICESQSYGIGAFAYYRRITEEIIDKLLDEVKDLIPEAELPKYISALDIMD